VKASSPPAGRRRGVVTRALRRVLLALLREEVDEMRRGLAAHQGAIDAHRAVMDSHRVGLAENRQHLAILEGRVAAAERDSSEMAAALAGLRGEVAQRWEAGEAARLELQAHLETQIAQLTAEVAELRHVLLSVRGEFEVVRDGRVPQLEEAVSRLHHAVVALQSGLAELAAVRLPRLEEDARRITGALQQVQTEIGLLSTTAQALQRELELLRDEAVPAAARDVAGLQAAWDDLQREVLSLRDAQLPRISEGLATLQRGLSEVQRLGEELRDQRLPALAARSDALLARLHEQLEVSAGVVDRLLAGEGLRIDTPAAVEAALPEALRRAHLAFLDQFRGEREETLARVDEHVSRLAEHGPVLDLGCGRGELLEALVRAGVEVWGVDADPAMVEACRRRGLAVVAGDALEVLAAQPPASLGAVTALHLFEHLPAGTWASLIQAAAAALKEGGVLLVECPNPEALRVGANLFWIDPTHRAPVHREAVAFVMRALGLEVVENVLLHPFPPEQKLAAADLPAEVRTLAARLDDLLSAPRDWLLVARKPPRSPAAG